MILEVCVDNFESAIAAIDGGAHRLEVCSALSIGGLTPSPGLIEQIRKYSNIPLHVLIRPRSGDFTYSNTEFETIINDISIYRSMNIQGIVCGVLLPNGNIDTIRTSEIIHLSKELSFTFHRAFDFVPNKDSALQELIELKADRILSSGGFENAIEGIEVLAKLIKIGENNIIIMPGAGVSSNNIHKLMKIGATEFHMSGKSIRKANSYPNKLKTGLEEGKFENIYITDKQKISNTIDKFQK